MNWMSKCDFGVVHPLVWVECRSGDGRVVETLRQIVEDDEFGAVEIAPPNDPAVRQAARELLASSGLQVVYLPILPLIVQKLPFADADSSARAATLERMKAHVIEAVEFGAPLAMIASQLDPGEGQREAAVDRLVEDIRALCDLALARSEKRLLHITLENFDRDIEKKRLIGSTAEAVELAQRVDRPNFGLTIDLSHLPLLNETPEDALKLAAPYLLHAHIGNCVIDYPESPIYGDFHPRFGHPQGRNDVPEVIRYLRALEEVDFYQRARSKLGTTPILSMELRTNASENDTPAFILANGKRTFKRAWASVYQG
jgi:sugar phosphate isomerase/epimerase